MIENQKKIDMENDRKDNEECHVITREREREETLVLYFILYLIVILIDFYIMDGNGTAGSVPPPHTGRGTGREIERVDLAPNRYGKT